ncbi:hypothetical protein GIB67_029963 [Kingdonia uniflora]|uniref:protein phosphatase methylesterase-1 n=1 Tax=Kingdonia uniflora TaxID=39325 RepID=A0A7J7MXR0_9MAGN|nr:hypothetical protein GIB67_029963 [Kingdonia uniflora]
MTETCSNLKPLAEEEEEDQIETLTSAFSSIPNRPPTQRSLEKYSPLQWSGYFDKEVDVRIAGSNDVFHVYMAGTEGPVVFCLHGGGYSGLSFALAASKIKEKARVVAMDMRGHGESSIENDLDLSIETLCNDVLAVLKAMYGDSPPAIVLVGHSMGGSVAVHVAAKKTIPRLAGLIVVDVVEGTAIASLMHMQKILSNRVQYFPTIEKAIEWSVKGGFLRNIESARISVPSTYRYDESKKCYSHRTRLEETETYWRGWYEGLSDLFLSCPVPKLLLLAGTDRLDRSLTIGQMQGKFQMIVVRHTGHAIQEDVPDEFASLILNFISRNRIGPNGVESHKILGIFFFSKQFIMGKALGRKAAKKPTQSERLASLEDANTLMVNKMDAMMTVILTLSTKNPSVEKEQNEGVHDNVESITKGRGRGLPMDPTMRAPLLTVAIALPITETVSTTVPTTTPIVASGNRDFPAPPTTTQPTTTFNTAALRLPPTENWGDNIPQTAPLGYESNSPHTLHNTSAAVTGFVPQREFVSQNQQRQSGFGFVRTDREQHGYWGDNGEINRGFTYRYIPVHERRGRRRGINTNNYVPRIRNDGFHSDSGIGGRRSQDTNQGDQIASAVITAIQTVGQDVKLNIPELDGKADADGFME